MSVKLDVCARFELISMQAPSTCRLLPGPPHRYPFPVLEVVVCNSGSRGASSGVLGESKLSVFGQDVLRRIGTDANTTSGQPVTQHLTNVCSNRFSVVFVLLVLIF